ncbi:MAG: ABC transporter ATP-binding protein [Gammaproteobacteria bacterium]|nr:ABC transporter ATP-binding protein [Gammaproteobacteria bacterium]
MSNIERIGGDSLLIDDVHFNYGAGAIFDGLSIDVQPGEFLSIIGPSGCGKTTLLNLLSGFLFPRQGSIKLRGKPIAPEDPHFGYVFQHATLFPWLTTVENVEFGLRMEGNLSPLERREKATRYLQLVGLEGFENYLPRHLSGGMQQRVSLARALVMEPRLLLMDEPFGALDAITRETMNDELLRLWDELGQTVVFITHDIDEAVYLSDRIVVLHRPPNGIFRDLSNDLPRPRSGPTTRTSELFWQYKKELIADIAVVANTTNPNSDDDFDDGPSARLLQEAAL